MFAGTGVIFAAVYLLWMVQRVFIRQSDKSEKQTFERFVLARDRSDRAAPFFDGLYGRLSATVSRCVETVGRGDSAESYASSRRRRSKKRKLHRRKRNIDFRKLKRIFAFLFLISAFAVFAEAQTYYGSTDTKIFRDGRDKEFRNKAESPLKEEDFPRFAGLNYFDEDKKYIVKADFKRTSDEKYFQMPTSSGKSKKFVKYGVLTFKLNGKKHSLNVYQADAEILKKYPEYADLLFVPFKDLTSGNETYGGGQIH